MPLCRYQSVQCAKICDTVLLKWSKCSEIYSACHRAPFRKRDRDLRLGFGSLASQLRELPPIA
jgi:hypothetical protein